MPYIVSYFITFFILLGLPELQIPSIYILFLGYANLILLFIRRDPFDPLLWLSFSWEFLFINYFSGAIIIPSHIEFTEPISYILVVLMTFVIAYYCGRRNRLQNKEITSNFLGLQGNLKMQHFLTFAAILTIIGGLAVTFEVFVINGFSLDGGERRSEFQDVLGSFSPLVTIGVILVAGAYFSIPALFFWGGVRNKILAIFAAVAFALSSIAIAGKQAIFVVFVILAFTYLMKTYYLVKTKTPKYLKIAILLLLLFMGSYIMVLSGERHNSSGEKGELLMSAVDLSTDFKKKVSAFLPISFQNTFAEMFGYYGFQIGTFSEQWNINHYKERYDLLPFLPRVLAPFSWLERQVIKVFPWYTEIYKDSFTPMGNELPIKDGYYHLSNWQTFMVSGIKTFGFVGLIIVVFFHGFFSRRLYEWFRLKPSYAGFCLLLWNNIFMIYTIMNGFSGSTDGLFFLLVAIYLFVRYKGKEPFFIKQIAK